MIDRGVGLAWLESSGFDTARKGFVDIPDLRLEPRASGL